MLASCGDCLLVTFISEVMLFTFDSFLSNSRSMIVFVSYLLSLLQSYIRYIIIDITVLLFTYVPTCVFHSFVHLLELPLPLINIVNLSYENFIVMKPYQS